MPAGETAAHRELKRLALEWAVGSRFVLAACEVRLPRCNYRADVAAATPRALAENGATVVFECKASRADFRRDSAAEARTETLVHELAGRLDGLRSMIGQHRPDLRRGEELFPEYDCIDLRGVRHATHASLTVRLRAAQRRLLDGTKFAKLARWRAATFLYLVAEEGLVARSEIPDGWGLLVRRGDALTCEVKPLRNDTSPAARVALLERIAACATRRHLMPRMVSHP